jgi:uncharacterized membrane protein
VSEQSAFLPAAAIDEARRRFPLWFSVWVGLSHVFTAALLTPPHTAASLTFLFPLAWVILYYVSLPTAERPARSTLLVLALTAPLLAVLWWLPARAMYDGSDLSTLRFGFEILAPLWAASLAAHCYGERGWPGVVLFFGLGAIYGFILENSGIELGFFSEAGYRVYVPLARTPLTSVAGWCTIFYPSVYVADAIVARSNFRSKIIVPALIVAAVAISTDLHFDPVATKLGMWTWHPTLAPVWFGVPIVNYTSWFAAVFAAAFVYYWSRSEIGAWRSEQSSPITHLQAPIYLVAALALSAIINLAAIGIIEGPDGPSWTILRHAIQTFSTP